MVFWGLIVKNLRKYKQVVEKDYHISHAVLDHDTVTHDEIVSLNIEVGGCSYIIGHFCMKHGILQLPLDIIFKRGETVTFSITGKSEDISLHLTGYTLEDKDIDSKESQKKEISATKEALVNLTNKEVKNKKNTSAPKSLITSASKDLQKENEAPSSKSLNKANGLKSSDSTEKKTDKKTKAKNKDLSFKDESNLFAEEEEEEDDDFEPEEGEEEEEEGEEDDEDEDEIDIDIGEEEEVEEEEDEREDDEWVDIEDDTKDESQEKKKDQDDLKSSPPKKKKRMLSPPSSAGRTPMVRSGKKQKIQDLSGSPTLAESSSKKNQNKSGNTDSSSNASVIKVSKENQRKDSSSSGEKSSTEGKSKKKILMGGVIIENLVEGTGAIAGRGKKALVYYEGKLSNGKVFDKVKDGKPFKFRLGANEVIKAWEVGVMGMKVGGKRKIIAPPAMAYGKEGAPPDIPPNSVLTFEVTLKGVNK